jgi:hypothetical protein
LLSWHSSSMKLQFSVELLTNRCVGHGLDES